MSELTNLIVSTKRQLEDARLHKDKLKTELIEAALNDLLDQLLAHAKS